MDKAKLLQISKYANKLKSAQRFLATLTIVVLWWQWDSSANVSKVFGGLMGMGLIFTSEVSGALEDLAKGLSESKEDPALPGA